MATKIDVSFKKTSKEQKLYNYFNSLEDRSNEIKLILNEWYERNVKANAVNEDRTFIEESEKVDTDITDF